jgi:predicted nucleotidyltransferase
MKHMFQNSNILKAINWFFQNPKDETSLRSLARKIKFSPSTLSRVLVLLHNDDFITKRQQGNSLLFKANPTPKFKALKTAYTIGKIQDCKIPQLIEEKSSSLSGIFLYGSAARGEDTNTSDYDFLIIASDCWVTQQELSARLGKETSIKTFSISKWNDISKTNRAFYLEIISSCISLKGEKPIID